MYDFETASAVLRDMERDRRHFRIQTAKRQEQTTARFARFRRSLDAFSPMLAAAIRRLADRL